MPQGTGSKKADKNWLLKNFIPMTREEILEAMNSVDWDEMGNIKKPKIK